MNFSDFKKRLGAEPRSRDPELLQAMDSNPEFRQAAQEAEEFENKLETAMALDVPAEVFQLVATVPERFPNGEVRKAPSGWRWLAAAAVFVAAVGFAGYTWYESTFHWDSVNDFVVDHWAVDGAKFLQEADGQAVEQTVAEKMFASLDMRLSPALAQRIDTLSKCKTPDGRGVHMVITTDQGPVTVIFMPKVETVEGHIMDLAQMQAATLELESGSAVIIGPNEEIIASVYAMARDGIRPIARTG